MWTSPVRSSPSAAALTARLALRRAPGYLLARRECCDQFSTCTGAVSGMQRADVVVHRRDRDAEIGGGGAVDKAPGDSEPDLALPAGERPGREPAGNRVSPNRHVDPIPDLPIRTARRSGARGARPHPESVPIDES